LALLLSKLLIIWLSMLSVPDESYYRNASCALNWISTFLLFTKVNYTYFYLFIHLLFFCFMK
jgi:hypothetical protein